MIVNNGGPMQSIAEATRFSFDDYSIALSKNLLMDLIPARKTPCRNCFYLSLRRCGQR